MKGGETIGARRGGGGGGREKKEMKKRNPPATWRYAYIYIYTHRKLSTILRLVSC